MPTLARVTLAVALLALAGATSTVLAAPCAGTGAQLCTDGTGDCTISDDCSVQSGLTLDLQGRPLVVSASKTLTIAGPGMLTLKANLGKPGIVGPPRITKGIL